MTPSSTISKGRTIEERIAELEKKVMQLERLLIPAEKASHPASRPSGTKQLSIKEFINQKQPTSSREVTLVIGYFIENYEEILPFNVRDLEDGFRAAKVPPPKNLNDMVNKNIAAGFFMESKQKKDGRKAWELTATGESRVEGAIGIKT